MNSTVDYTPVLLAQLTDLQQRVTKQDTTISALKAEVERLIGQPLNITNTMRTSVPLRSHDTSDTRPNFNQREPRTTDGMQRGPRTTDGMQRGMQREPRHTDDIQRGMQRGMQRDMQREPRTTDGPRSRPKIAGSTDVLQKSSYPTMSLSDVLNKDEKVTIQVGIGKDDEGKFSYTTAQAIFDGTELNVTECELVESLVGMKSAKPGEILYKFIDELKNSNHIKKTFTIAPWRLCFVERNGVRQTLEDLRNIIG
jgi:hypothetical protein